MIHRAYFFDSVRYYLDSNRALTAEQVDGLEALLGYYEGPAGVDFDDRMLAYILATTWHETAFTMQPIREYGSQSYLQSKPYYPWFGRGYVQLTWEDNYKRQDKKLNLGGALVRDPDLALTPPVALPVLFLGMRDGDFTGKRLAAFFTVEETDWYNARTIVNGHDCAADIAAYAEKFLNAIAHTFDPPRRAAPEEDLPMTKRPEDDAPEPGEEPVPAEPGEGDEPGEDNPA